MDSVWLVVIGVFIGSSLGMLAASALASGKIEDSYIEGYKNGLIRGRGEE